jgi:hypothetical protein
MIGSCAFQGQQTVLLGSLPSVFLNVHKRESILAGLLLKDADSSVHPTGMSILGPMTQLASRIFIVVPSQVAISKLKPAVLVLFAKTTPLVEGAVEGATTPPEAYFLAYSIHPASELGRGLPSRRVDVGPTVWAMGQTFNIRVGRASETKLLCTRGADALHLRSHRLGGARRGRVHSERMPAGRGEALVPSCSHRSMTLRALCAPSPSNSLNTAFVHFKKNRFCRTTIKW